MSGSGWDALLDVREWTENPTGMFGNSREALPDVQE